MESLFPAATPPQAQQAAKERQPIAGLLTEGVWDAILLAAFEMTKIAAETRNAFSVQECEKEILSTLAEDYDIEPVGDSGTILITEAEEEWIGD